MDQFYPDRMAKRILGMGDVLTLVERPSKILMKKRLRESIKKSKKTSLALMIF